MDRVEMRDCWTENLSVKKNDKMAGKVRLVQPLLLSLRSREATKLANNKTK